MSPVRDPDGGFFVVFCFAWKNIIPIYPLCMKQPCKKVSSIVELYRIQFQNSHIMDKPDGVVARLFSGSGWV